MEKGFTIKETKNCRQYTKHVYEFSAVLDDTFLSSFSIFGTPEITNFKQYLPESSDLFRIRNVAFGFELAGSLNGHDLIVTYKKKDQEIISMVESELKSWVFSDKIS